MTSRVDQESPAAQVCGKHLCTAARQKEVAESNEDAQFFKPDFTKCARICASSRAFMSSDIFRKDRADLSATEKKFLRTADYARLDGRRPSRQNSWSATGIWHLHWFHWLLVLGVVPLGRANFVFNSFQKKSEKTPNKEIELALKLKKEYFKLKRK